MIIYLSDKLTNDLPASVVDAAKTIERRLSPGVEASSFADTSRLVETPFHPLLGAVDFAYRKHYDVTLRPDDVWLAIAQGFALHVEKYAEALRRKFVAHDGQVTIKVRRDRFVKGSPNNDWAGAYAEFSDQIAEHIGREKQQLFVNDFSTTGTVDKTASEVVLMGAMKAYFKYEMHTLCDIPAIHLAGTRSDWQSVRDRAAVLNEFHQDDAPIKWWIDRLLPVLDRFVTAFAGDTDKKFWCAIYKEHGGSGGPYISGWINTLFPYFEGTNWKTQKSEIFSVDQLQEQRTTEAFPAGVTRVPFEWHYLGNVINMEFLGGFLLTTWETIEGRTAIRPVIGWCVRDPAGKPVVNKKEDALRQMGLDEAEIHNILAKRGCADDCR